MNLAGFDRSWTGFEGELEWFVIGFEGGKIPFSKGSGPGASVVAAGAGILRDCAYENACKHG